MEFIQWKVIIIIIISRTSGVEVGQLFHVSNTFVNLNLWIKFISTCKKNSTTTLQVNNTYILAICFSLFGFKSIIFTLIKKSKWPGRGLVRLYTQYYRQNLSYDLIQAYTHINWYLHPTIVLGVHIHIKPLCVFFARSQMKRCYPYLS